MLCHPEAIFRHLLADRRPRAPAPCLGARATRRVDHPEALADLARHARVSASSTASPLATCGRSRPPGYLVNNSTFPPSFASARGRSTSTRGTARPSSTWATTSRRAGSAPRATSCATSSSADYLLSSPPYMTSTMYGGLPPRQHLTAVRSSRRATPGSTARCSTRPTVGAVVARLRAPGWTSVATPRGSSSTPPRGGACPSTTRRRRPRAGRARAPLQERLGAGHLVVLKVHQQVYDLARAHAELTGLWSPTTSRPTSCSESRTSWSPTLQRPLRLLGYTDRPSCSSSPDLDKYAADRGLYLTESSSPHPWCTELDEPLRWSWPRAPEPRPTRWSRTRSAYDAAASSSPPRTTAGRRPASSTWSGRGRRDGYVGCTDRS